MVEQIMSELIMLKTQKAFTLIELMVTLAVLAVVLGLALPNFNRQILNNKSTSLGEDLVSQINLARYEAIKRGTRVSMCASSNSTTTTPTCTGNWTEGYIMFVDNATSDQASAVDLGTAGSNMVIIKKFSKPDVKAVITVENDAASVSFFRYTALGTLGRISGSTNPIKIEASMTGCNGNNVRSITIGLSGLVSSQVISCR